MDGLTAACQAALDSGTAGTRHGAAPHLSILVEESTLAAGAGAPGHADASRPRRDQRAQDRPDGRRPA